MILDFDQNIKSFLASCHKNNVEMILVGGGAVNFHGYQRHSADLDFWIEPSSINLQKLIKALQEIGFEINEFPEKVKKSMQNISIKISPVTDIELITRFNPGKTFEEAYKQSVKSKKEELMYRVISFDDLIESKIKANRPKDLLDIQELQRINKQNG